MVDMVSVVELLTLHPDVIMIFLVVFLTLGLMLGIVIGFIKFNVYRWVKFKRALLKKNFGIIYFRSHGKTLQPLIRNLDSDMIKIRDGIWILDKNKIYRETKLTSGKTVKIDKKLVTEIDPSQIEFLEGVPVLFLDIKDMLPLRFEHDPATGISREPSQVEASLAKEIAAAEAEALHLMKSKTMMALVICVIIAGAAMAFSLLGFVNTNNLISDLSAINQTILQMNATIMNAIGVG